MTELQTDLSRGSGRQIAFWMILSSLFFAGMGVGVKYASSAYTSAELVFWRGLIGMAFIAVLARSQGVSIRTPYPKMHASRSIVGTLSLSTWFYAIAHMPLATAMTLNYMSSVWIAAFLVGGALLAWVPVPGRDGAEPAPPFHLSLVCTVIAGFVGVMLILKPSSSGGDSYAGIAGLLSGLLSALAYMQVMALSRIGEPEIRVVFYFALGAAVMGGLWMLVTGLSRWSWQQSIWLLMVGITAALAQLALTRAYALARTQAGALVAANLQYSGIVFASVFGLFIFGDRIDLAGWGGMALVIGSGIAATILRQRAVQQAPAEDH